MGTLAKQMGYRTAYMGKWHLGDEMIRQHGFDEWISTEEYREYVSKEEYRRLNCRYHEFLLESGFKPDEEGDDYVAFSRFFCTRLPERYSKPAFTAAEASRFIKENRDRPFALYVNFLEPHPPYYSAYDDFYDPAQVDLPSEFNSELSEDKPRYHHLMRKFTREKGRHFPMKDERTWRKLIARYWGAVSLIDKYTGVILDALRESGVEEDTIVVFTSDHGDMMGDFRMIQKGVMYESATRVPFLIRIPGLSDQGPIIEEPVSLIDAVPTLLDAMGHTAPVNVDGKSLYPLLKGSPQLEYNDVFIEWNKEEYEDEWPAKYKEIEEARLVDELLSSGARAVVTPDGWKMSINQTGEHELYNLNDDPGEATNLYFLGGHEGVIESLRKKIVEWQRQTGDELELPLD